MQNWETFFPFNGRIEYIETKICEGKGFRNSDSTIGKTENKAAIGKIAFRALLGAEGVLHSMTGFLSSC
jgi:hypothetical protein